MKTNADGQISLRVYFPFRPRSASDASRYHDMATPSRRARARTHFKIKLGLPIAVESIDNMGRIVKKSFLGTRKTKILVCYGFSVTPPAISSKGLLYAVIYRSRITIFGCAIDVKKTSHLAFCLQPLTKCLVLLPAKTRILQTFRMGR